MEVTIINMYSRCASIANSHRRSFLALMHTCYTRAVLLNDELELFILEITMIHGATATVDAYWGLAIAMVNDASIILCMSICVCMPLM